MGARSAATIALSLIATPVFADVLPIGGPFGNASGCHLYATGNKLGDDYLLLTPDTFSSAAIGCDFNALASSNLVVFTVEAVCSPGGKSTVRVTDFGADGFTVSVDDHRGIFDGLKACPPANDGEHA